MSDPGRMSDREIAAPTQDGAAIGGPSGQPGALRLAPIANPALLALDSSGAACSVAVWRGGALLAHRAQAMTRGHGERLLPMVAETMRAAELEMTALDAIAVTVGPGSFTGLRIGLAAARGLGLALGRPVVGITSFLAVAASLPETVRDARAILIALDTRREDLFLQRFEPGLRATGPARLATPAEAVAGLPAGPLLLAGDGLALLAPLLPRHRDIALAAGPGHIEAAGFVALAARLLAEGGEAPEGPLLLPEPFYLRAPDVTLPAGLLPP